MAAWLGAGLTAGLLARWATPAPDQGARALLYFVPPVATTAGQDSSSQENWNSPVDWARYQLDGPELTTWVAGALGPEASPALRERAATLQHPGRLTSSQPQEDCLQIEVHERDPNLAISQCRLVTDFLKAQSQAQLEMALRQNLEARDKDLQEAEKASAYEQEFQAELADPNSFITGFALERYVGASRKLAAGLRRRRAREAYLRSKVPTILVIQPPTEFSDAH